MLQKILGFLSLCVMWCGLPAPLLKQVAIAQTSPATLTTDGSTNTTITGNAPFTITEGTLRVDSKDGNAATLFHSFDAFSPSASSVVFDLRDAQNTIDTQLVNLIIGRVTGGANSFIDGNLSISQDANTPTPDLFIFNPNGIVFGPNARLNLPGSFLASTASGVRFEGGQVFSANDLNSPPILTVSAPTGLQLFNDSNGVSDGITVQGTGHDVATFNPALAPYIQVGANAGLTVAAGNTLALVGQNVTLQNGVLNAPGGQIELGGVEAGNAGLNWQAGALAVTYDDVEDFGDVRLVESAIANASGPTAGAIQIQGRNIEIGDGSLVWNQNQGLEDGRSISVSASEQLSVAGHTPTLSAFSGIISETVAPLPGAGSAASIKITAPSIDVRDGGNITSRTFSPGNSQDITINAQKVAIDGFTAASPNIFAVLGTISFSTGKAGNIVGRVGDLSITEGGYLGSTTFGSGGSGDVRLVAGDVLVSGTTPLGLSSLISSNSIGPQGESGNLSLTVNSLVVEESGTVTTTSASRGNAGDIQITASDSITLRQQKPGLSLSTIASTVEFAPEFAQRLLGISGSVPEGDAGNVTIQTPLLRILEGGAVTVANPVKGNAGELTINAHTLEVLNAEIDAFTTFGEGGNIFLNVEESLLMRNGQIRTTAAGVGNGGNITIESPIILGIDDSNIVADAVTGNGGNINITTREIFGLAFRETPTPESNDISASSEFGVSGTVSIDGFSVAADAGLVNLPAEVSDESDRIVKGCGTDDSSQFIASGRGGLSVAPVETVSVARLWQDVREPDPSAVPLPQSVITATEISAVEADANAVPRLIEATGFAKTQGDILLVAATDREIPTSSPTCLY